MECVIMCEQNGEIYFGDHASSWLTFMCHTEISIIFILKIHFVSISSNPHVVY